MKNTAIKTLPTRARRSYTCLICSQAFALFVAALGTLAQTTTTPPPTGNAASGEVFFDVDYQLDFQLLQRVIPAVVPWPLRPDLINDDEIPPLISYLKKI